jgi:cell division protein FtsB
MENDPRITPLGRFLRKTSLDEIEKNKSEMYKLENDNEYLEKFAREHYHMKNKNEEIFIIKD